MLPSTGHMMDKPLESDDRWLTVAVPLLLLMIGACRLRAVFSRTSKLNEYSDSLTNFLHPSSSAYPILIRRWVAVPAVMGQEAEYTLKKSPICCRANTSRQTTIHAHLESPIKRTPCISLDCGRKPESPTCKLHIERPPGWN